MARLTSSLTPHSRSRTSTCQLVGLIGGLSVSFTCPTHHMSSRCPVPIRHAVLRRRVTYRTRIGALCVDDIFTVSADARALFRHYGSNPGWLLASAFVYCIHRAEKGDRNVNGPPFCSWLDALI